MLKNIRKLLKDEEGGRLWSTAHGGGRRGRADLVAYFSAPIGNTLNNVSQHM